MSTFLISDLHLDDRRPETTALLQTFLRTEAVNADALYVLGDLFEFWLGDDASSKNALEVAKSFAQLTAQGIPCYFMHGNRDFLLQKAYADLAGMKLLPEEHVADFYGERVLLIHGDSLCTDDLPYQLFRTMVRNPAWQQEFLSKTPQQRLEIALKARESSAEHKGNVDMSIMDVNQEEVIKAFKRHDVLRMIHGHTHRLATHDLIINDQPAQRVVLGDWYTKGSYLKVSPDGYEMMYL